jgi:hypothetical protein
MEYAEIRRFSARDQSGGLPLGFCPTSNRRNQMAVPGYAFRGVGEANQFYTQGSVFSGGSNRHSQLRQQELCRSTTNLCRAPLDLSTFLWQHYSL